MKRRAVEPEETPLSPLDFLCEALLTLKTVEEVRAFLRDLTTPAELEALTDRWRVVPLLMDGVAYREIHDRTAVSVTTIGRVARFWPANTVAMPPPHGDCSGASAGRSPGARAEPLQDESSPIGVRERR